MGRRIDSDKLSSIISEIQKRLEDLKTRCTSDPDNAKEILSDALEQLQAISQQLSSIRAAVVSQDITECKKEEEALNEREGKFRASFENSIDAILLTSPDDGKIEAANPAACKMFGMTEEEIIRAGRSGIVDTNDPRLEGAIEERARTQRFRGEINHKRKDGTIFPAEVSTALFTDKNGKVKTTMIIRDITERKLIEEKMTLAKLKAEEITRSAERQFREMEAAFSSIADGVVVYDKSANITYMNKAAKRISGLAENDFTRPFAERIKSIISPNGYHFRSEELPFSRALKGEIVKDFEMVADRGHGMKFTVLASAATIYDDNGEIVGVVSTMKDITERKEAELKLVEAIKKAEQNQLILDTVIQQMPAGVIITDASGTTAKNNEAMDRIWKREMLPTENIESHGYRAFHTNGSEYLPDEWPLTRALKRGEVTIDEEMSILRGDGTKGTLSVSSTPIRDSNGKIIAGVVVDVDITKQKQMEKVLRKAKDELEQRVQERTAELEEANRTLRSSEHRLILAQKAGSVGVYDSNIVTGEIFWNSELEKIFGMPAPADPRQRHDVWLSCVHSEDRQYVLKELQYLLESSCEGHEGEYRFIRPDGEIRWISAFDLVIRDSDNRPVRIIGTHIDITDRKLAEIELIKAKEAAEVAAKAKTAFMANMSHELRTPMNYIVGMTSLLLDEPLTPELRDYIETIKKGSDEMIALINNILSFSEVEKKKVALEYKHLSLQALINNSVKMVESQAIKKGLNLTTTVNYGTPDKILGDQGRLAQVLSHLLSNAVKFTDEGAISLILSSEYIEGNKHQFLFAVEDMGIGIPSDMMDELFQPFSQVETTLSRKRDGAGIGLATCKGLVELMGGKIWAKSEIGKGSTFYFTIEAEVPPNNSIKPTVMSEEMIKAVPKALAEQLPLRILVAEDEPSNRKVIIEMLKRIGYKADAVANGKVVLQALEMRSYDLILMDVKMPEMDGIEAAKEIRQRWPNNGPKIVAITAYTLAGDKEKCLEAGMDGYIAKPVQMRELAEVLKRCALDAR